MHNYLDIQYALPLSLACCLLLFLHIFSLSLLISLPLHSTPYHTTHTHTTHICMVVMVTRALPNCNKLFTVLKWAAAAAESEQRFPQRHTKSSEIMYVTFMNSLSSNQKELKKQLKPRKENYSQTEAKRNEIDEANECAMIQRRMMAMTTTTTTTTAATGDMLSLLCTARTTDAKDAHAEVRCVHKMALIFYCCRRHRCCCFYCTFPNNGLCTCLCMCDGIVWCHRFNYT